jgi:hypothetical protein
MDYGEVYQYAAMNSRATPTALLRRLAACGRIRPALPVRLFPNPLARWGELQLQPDGKDAAGISQVAADPARVDMDRVVSTMHPAIPSA